MSPPDVLTISAARDTAALEVLEVEALNHGHGVRLAMQGSADAVVKAAARYPVVSLTSYEPSLEDIFLRYYEGDGPRSTEADHVA